MVDVNPLSPTMMMMMVLTDGKSSSQIPLTLRKIHSPFYIFITPISASVHPYMLGYPRSRPDDDQRKCSGSQVQTNSCNEKGAQGKKSPRLITNKKYVFSAQIKINKVRK